MSEQKTQEMQVSSVDQDDPLEEGMATHSSVLAWRIPWTEEPAGLQSIESQRVGQDTAKSSLETGVISFWILVVLRSKV